MTFTNWLAGQTKREDPIGDLARDVAYDTTWPATADRYADFVAHLRGQSAAPVVFELLAQAWQEYERSSS